MRPLLSAALACALMIVSSTLAAQARPPLNEVAEIDDALFDLGIADRIRKECPTISARMLKAIGYVRNLENRAEALGYSAAEIDAYTDSDADKDRLRAKAKVYFQERGVAAGDVQSFCRLGEREIAAGSRIGSLLRLR